jgi:hypothetical protein
MNLTLSRHGCRAALHAENDPRRKVLFASAFARPARADNLGVLSSRPRAAWLRREDALTLMTRLNRNGRSQEP